MMKKNNSFPAGLILYLVIFTCRRPAHLLVRCFRCLIFRRIPFTGKLYKSGSFIQIMFCFSTVLFWFVRGIVKTNPVILQQGRCREANHTTWANESFVWAEHYFMITAPSQLPLQRFKGNRCPNQLDADPADHRKRFVVISGLIS